MNQNIVNEINSKLESISDLKKKKLITSILKKDDWYKKVSFDTAISILIDLGYTKEEALLIYKQLVME